MDDATTRRHIDEHADAVVRGDDGKQIAAVPLVTSGKTLLAIVMNPRDCGAFQLDHPEVDLVLRQGGSNVEEALAPWLEPRDQHAARRGISLAGRRSTRA